MTIVVTAGHVDHGKSALIEALTGTNPDRWVEERGRGLTIDLGYAHAVLPSGREVSFVDVPGHTQFTANMLAGVCTAPTCLFVIDSTQGWQAQTVEHLAVLDVLAIGGGIIALTKSDSAGPAQLAELARETVARTAGTVLAGAAILATSARTGDGLDALRVALDDHLATIPPVRGDGRARLWIDRAFTIRGSGTVVTGVSVGGGFRVGERLGVVPSDQSVRVRAIQTRGRVVDAVGAGERVALNLVGVDREQVRRGDAVVSPEEWFVTDRVDADLSVSESLDHGVTSKGSYALYVGTADLTVRLQVIGGSCIEPGERGLVRYRLAGALPLAPGDRYVLREVGRQITVGGGVVLDVAPVLPASRAVPDMSWERVVDERGWVAPEELARLTGHQAAANVGHWLASAAAVAKASDRLRSRVAQAGALGLAVGELGGHERAILPSLDDLQSDGRHVVVAGSDDPLAAHPAIGQLRAGGLAPPTPDASPATLRALERRGVIVDCSGTWFHADAVERAASIARDLLHQRPDGFTVADFRAAADSTRKYVLPLLKELDNRAVTRFRDPVRVAGPHLG